MALTPGKYASTLDLLWDVAFMSGCLAGCDTQIAIGLMICCHQEMSRVDGVVLFISCA
ncbi:hypothetical protein Peur_071060 [Populus x canadensis]